MFIFPSFFKFQFYAVWEHKRSIVVIDFSIKDITHTINYENTECTTEHKGRIIKECFYSEIDIFS
jgi:hypothetical protein